MQHYTEDAFIEQPALALFATMGYETLNALQEQAGKCRITKRPKDSEVVLVERLRTALQRLNPTLSPDTIELAIEELRSDRSSLSSVRANQEIYQYLKDGVKVAWHSEEDTHSEEGTAEVRVIDWDHPENNDFLVVSQFWVRGSIYRRRADLVVFVNGLPLVVIELKAAHNRLKEAFTNNIHDYKQTIPQLFWYNALIIVSNGRESRVGSITAGWEHFFEWKKITSEGEKGLVSLDTMLRGTCDKTRLLDIIENFTLYSDERGSLIKLIAQNHQYLGVNNAFAAVQKREQNAGKLGVFWHTQGSGKSYSMVFFTQKVLRKLPGSWTFLVVTDREDLDKQIYQTFQHTGAVKEPSDAPKKSPTRASSAAHLQQLLQENHRLIFTLIQKFRTELLDATTRIDSKNIIVITDEAHRTQYDTLAANMHGVLPNAAFIGFTGTPLIVGEEKTREVFGDYVSTYKFSDAIRDGATVPLYYENRTPELQLTNLDLNEDLEQLLEEENLEEEQERVLAREFSREYNLITREERLEKVAEDIVAHFMGRGHLGKAMVVSIDKLTAVRMYDKVHKYWQRDLDKLRAELQATPETEVELRQELAEKIAYMENTERAVVVSEAQNEVEKFTKKGLDITRHRLRMKQEDLEERFKAPDDPLRIVFVCAMWMTGFDVPSLSTVYLDKPMRNHTLMQTIARANRVFQEKVNGLIVDYVGIFRNLQKALAIYGASDDGETELPIKDKGELIQLLARTLADTENFCQTRNIDLGGMLATQGKKSFEHINKIEAAVEAIVVNDDTRRQYLALVANLNQLYKAILPDASALTYAPHIAMYTEIARWMRKRLAAGDEELSELMDNVTDLMDASIGTRRYIIRESTGTFDAPGIIDLSKLDLDALKARFVEGQKNTQAGQLRGQINGKIKQMVRLNKSRINYQERLQRLIDGYNQGSANVDIFYYQLLDLMQELQVEDQRTIIEQLSEEELAVFDLLTRPEMELSPEEKEQVKKIARSLLETLKREKLVLDWRKKQQARAQVKQTVRRILDTLPSRYTQEMYTQKCLEVYEHIYSSYYGEGRSIYSAMGF